jgi:hypothetical protein
MDCQRAYDEAQSKNATPEPRLHCFHLLSLLTLICYRQSDNVLGLVKQKPQYFRAVHCLKPRIFF